MDCMMSGSVPAAMSCLAYAVRSEPGVTNFLTVRPGTPESFMPCAMTPSQNEAVSAGVSNTIQLISTGAVLGSALGWGTSVAWGASVGETDDGAHAVNTSVTTASRTNSLDFMSYILFLNLA